MKARRTQRQGRCLRCLSQPSITWPHTGCPASFRIVWLCTRVRILVAPPCAPPPAPAPCRTPRSCRRACPPTTVSPPQTQTKQMYNTMLACGHGKRPVTHIVVDLALELLHPLERALVLGAHLVDVVRRKVVVAAAEGALLVEHPGVVLLQHTHVVLKALDLLHLGLDPVGGSTERLGCRR